MKIRINLKLLFGLIRNYFKTKEILIYKTVAKDTLTVKFRSGKDTNFTRHQLTYFTDQRSCYITELAIEQMFDPKYLSPLVHSLEEVLGPGDNTVSFVVKNKEFDPLADITPVSDLTKNNPIIPVVQISNLIDNCPIAPISAILADKAPLQSLLCLKRKISEDLTEKVTQTLRDMDKKIAEVFEKETM